MATFSPRDIRCDLLYYPSISPRYNGGVTVQSILCVAARTRKCVRNSRLRFFASGEARAESRSDFNSRNVKKNCSIATRCTLVYALITRVSFSLFTWRLVARNAPTRALQIVYPACVSLGSSILFPRVFCFVFFFFLTATVLHTFHATISRSLWVPCAFSRDCFSLRDTTDMLADRFPRRRIIAMPSPLRTRGRKTYRRN